MPKIPDSTPESSDQPHPALSIPHRGRLGDSAGVSPWRKEVVEGVRCRQEEDASDLQAMQEPLERTERAPWHGSPWDPSLQVWAARWAEPPSPAQLPGGVCTQGQAPVMPSVGPSAPQGCRPGAAENKPGVPNRSRGAVSEVPSPWSPQGGYHSPSFGGGGCTYTPCSVLPLLLHPRLPSTTSVSR